MPFVAGEHLRWGDCWIEPGDPVPDDDPARDYASMLLHGQIAEVVAAPVDSSAFEQAVTERDEAVDKVAAVEAERDDHLARALQAETERDEAIAALEQVRKDMEGVVSRQVELEAERDELAKQLEEATAPTPASTPAAKKAAAKK